MIVVGFLLVALLGTLLEGLVIMLVMLGLHNLVSESIPAVGFWGSVLIALALNIVGGAFRGRG